MRRGASANALLGLMPPNRGELHLFDSFQGLPEPWDRGEGIGITPVGHFACEPPTFKDKRVRIWEGLFSDTLDAFVVEFAGRGEELDLLHLDCDIYSSTICVLDYVRPLTSKGTVLLFDDIFGYPTWRDGQWKAWREWIGDLPHRWIGRTAQGQAAVRMDGSWV